MVEFRQPVFMIESLGRITKVLVDAHCELLISPIPILISDSPSRHTRHLPSDNLQS